MKKIVLDTGLWLCLFLLAAGTGYAEQGVVAHKVDKEPVIDGKSDDKVWILAKQITTHDKVANISITLKAVYTNNKIFFLVGYPDKEPSLTHRNWVWDPKEEEYGQGKDREDVFVLKWNMENRAVDLSVFADNSYSADVWFWKACRTNPSGYADDKIQHLSTNPQKKAKEITGKSGKKMYLQRKGDEGDSAYKSSLAIDYKGDTVRRFINRQPSRSRADIKAKGVWKDGRWTIEFGRALVTGNNDDIQFDIKHDYLFGISRYEIAGREPETDSYQPLYGCGDVGEKLTLKFGSK